jgi:hypothetical protein
MKKFTSLGVAIFAALIMVGLSSQANAVVLGIYEKGLLVPVTTHGSPGIDTAVGILCSDNTIVYWTFFDKQSNPVVDKQFKCTKNDYYRFSLNEEAPNTEGVEGYIVFTANGDMVNDPDNGLRKTSKLNCDDNKTIAGNAFLLDMNNDDAIFVPVIPLICYDYDLAQGIDLTAMTSSSLVGLWYGFHACPDPSRPNNYVDLRYWLDPAFGACTNVTIWTTECLNEWWRLVDPLDVPENCYWDNDPTNPTPWILKCHLNVYDDQEHRTSVSIPLLCEVTQFFPSSIVGWPDYKDGFIRIPLKDLMPNPNSGAPYGSGAFGFSYITSTTYRAAQTLLAAEAFTRWVPTCNAAPSQPSGNPPCGCPR